MNRLLILLSEYKKFFDNGHGGASGGEMPEGLANLDTQLAGLGNETYAVVYKFAIFGCVISLILIFVCRFIFRIASPREDAKAKAYIQTVLVITFLVSMITVLFETVMIVADVL